MESQNKSNYRFEDDNLGRCLAWHVKYPNVIFLIGQSATMNDFWLDFEGQRIGATVHQNGSDLTTEKVFSLAKNTLRSFVHNLKRSTRDDSSRNKSGF